MCITSQKIILALLLLVIPFGFTDAQESIPTYTTRTRSFKIPFENAAMDESIETSLWVSHDRGKNWSAFAKQTGSSGQFQFKTKTDGEFWFRSQLGPAPVANGSTPQLRIYVDATPPKLLITASNLPNRDVFIECRVSDRTAVANQVLFQITTGPEQPWQQLPFQAPPVRTKNGEVRAVARYTPDTRSRVVVVRAIARDGAGNTTGQTKQVFINAPR